MNNNNYYVTLQVTQALKKSDNYYASHKYMQGLLYNNSL